MVQPRVLRCRPCSLRRSGEVPHLTRRLFPCPFPKHGCERVRRLRSTRRLRRSLDRQRGRADRPERCLFSRAPSVRCSRGAGRGLPRLPGVPDRVPSRMPLRSQGGSYMHGLRGASVCAPGCDPLYLSGCQRPLCVPEDEREPIALPADVHVVFGSLNRGVAVRARPSREWNLSRLDRSLLRHPERLPGTAICLSWAGRRPRSWPDARN